MNTGARRFAFAWLMGAVGLIGCASDPPVGSATSTTTASSSGTGGSTGTTGSGGAGATVMDYGLTWVDIAAGNFEMGCSPNDEDCMPDELPVHTVTLAAFQLSRTEVTVAQFNQTLSGGQGACDDCPVASLTYDRAKAFCEAVEGRLPTEAEWEYAAKAGTSTRYTCGDDSACLDGIAWYSSNGAGVAHPVGQKLANAFGLHDMLGNALEFTADFYADDYYAASSSRNPPGPTSGTMRVLRGGGYQFAPQFMRVTLRNHDAEPVVSEQMRGVRCARSGNR